MYAASVKSSKENKNKAAANKVAQKKSNFQPLRMNPGSFSQSDVIVLQRTIGNRATAKLIHQILNPNIYQGIPKQRKCEKCPPEEDFSPAEQETIQQKVGANVIQLYCKGTDHDTSLEHVAIELDYIKNVNANAEREFSLKHGSVETFLNGIHKDGYADLADSTANTIYDIKRDDEKYPKDQLQQYLWSANEYCEGSWGLGTYYPSVRYIPFQGGKLLIAQKGLKGVISYKKVNKKDTNINENEIADSSVCKVTVYLNSEKTGGIGYVCEFTVTFDDGKKEEMMIDGTVNYDDITQEMLSTVISKVKKRTVFVRDFNRVITD